MSSKRKYAKRPIEASEGDLADDAFVAGILEATSWAKRHQQKLITGGIVLVLAIASGIYYVNFRGSQAERAVTELERVQQTIGLGNRDAARGELQNFIERYGGTPFALEARLLLGQLHLEAGEAEQAISALEPVRSEMGNPLAVQGATLLAGAYEEAGQPDEAVETYRLIANRTDLEFQLREALMHAGRLLTAQGELDEARSIYEELLAGMEDDDPVRGILELRIAELSARS